MKLAINYSLQAARLLAQGQIEIDRFKCPDWPNLVAEASHLHPVAVHFGLNAGSGRLKDSDWEPVARLLEQTGTPYVNLHLAPETTDFPDFPVDALTPEQTALVITRMISDVQAVVQRFGPERVIAENVPYRGASGKVLQPAVEPAVLHHVLEETGCGLLLDISHARIAARHLGIDERQYIAQLPVHRLRELHFTGLHRLDGQWQDHLSILDTDWPILEWVMERIQSGEWNRPWMLAFEYGGVGEKFAWRSDPGVIGGQMPRLHATVKSV